MKKSLLAIAAAGAFAGAAQAQSSVTVYGIVDMGYIGSNQILAANSANSISGQAITKTTTGGIAAGGQSTNRLGFRGTEDLGGGTRAFFTLEIALGMNDSNLVGSNGSTVGLNGTGVSNANRQAFVGLAQKGLGQFSLGTQYTPIHTNVGLTSANGQNNIMGDMIYTAGTTQNYTVTSGAVNAPTAQPSSSLASSSTSGYTVRAGNMLLLQSENISGLRAQAFIVANGMNNTQGTTTIGTNENGGPNNRNGYGGALNFSAGKFLATANYQTFKAVNPYGTGDTTCTTSTSSACTSSAGGAAVFASSAQTGVNIGDTQYYLGATYDFGFVQAYLQYINRKWISMVNPAYYGTRSAQQIGVKGKVSANVDYFASIGNGSYQALQTSTANAAKQNIIGYQLGTNYYLSKRTNLYAIFGGYGASTSGSGSTNALANNAYNGNNYAVGVRHTF